MQISAPHSVRCLENNNILVFNRGWQAPGVCSNAMEINVDVAAKKATKTWSYESASCYQVYYLGGTDRLWNGNTLVNWSTSGVIEEVNKDGKVVWSLNSGIGHGFAFIERVQSLYSE